MTNLQQLTILAQGGDGGGAAALLAPLISLVLTIVMIVGLWKVHTKAGQPGWAIFVPIYNVYVLLLIAGRPGWWLILAHDPHR